MADRLHFPDLVAGGWRALAFQPFREGVEIYPLIDGGDGAASAALLRYHPGAAVPRHLHQGLEAILVLEGAQSDERGRYDAGDFVLNAAGTEHSVWSDEGCVVLIQWERPVRMLEEEDESGAERQNERA